jgi:hypothetical protein
MLPAADFAIRVDLWSYVRCSLVGGHRRRRTDPSNVGLESLRLSIPSETASPASTISRSSRLLGLENRITGGDRRPAELRNASPFDRLWARSAGRSQLWPALHYCVPVSLWLGQSSRSRTARRPPAGRLSAVIPRARHRQRHSRRLRRHLPRRHPRARPHPLGGGRYGVDLSVDVTDVNTGKQVTARPAGDAFDGVVLAPPFAAWIAISQQPDWFVQALNGQTGQTTTLDGTCSIGSCANEVTRDPFGDLQITRCLGGCSPPGATLVWWTRNGVWRFARVG